MFIQKIRTHFDKLSDSNFEVRTQHILESMDGNIDFPKPEPSVADFAKAVTRYSDGLVKAGTQDRNALAEKNEARMELELHCIQLGNSVMTVSKGNVKMLTGSGFPLTKKPEPKHLAPVGPVSLANTANSGEMKASVKAVAGSRSYVYECTGSLPTETTKWDSITASTRSFIFKGLTPGKQYWIRVIATGARQQVQYSPVSNLYAQ